MGTGGTCRNRVTDEGSDAHGTFHEVSDAHGTFHYGSDNHGSFHDGSDAHGPFHYGSDNHGPFHDGSDAHGPFHEGSDAHAPLHDGSDAHGPFHDGSDAHGPFHECSDAQGPFHEGSDAHGPFHEGSDVHGPFQDQHFSFFISRFLFSNSSPLLVGTYCPRTRLSCHPHPHLTKPVNYSQSLYLQARLKLSPDRSPCRATWSLPSKRCGHRLALPDHVVKDIPDWRLNVSIYRITG